MSIATDVSRRRDEPGGTKHVITHRNPMQYLLMIYANEQEAAKRTPAEQGAVFAAYGVFNKEFGPTGKLLGGEPLEPTSTSTTVRVREGKVLHTDGPFAETKEQLGGYYVVEATDLDDALAIAAKIPAAKNGCVEVRPIMVLEERP
ncbi:MAG: hypothetical protein ACI9MR_002823 [Myxococcota bacterium]